MVEKLLRCSEEDLLRRINEIWQQEKLCIIMIKDILMYMDKNYVPKVKLQSVEHLQMTQFQRHVIQNQNIKHRLISKIMAEIKVLTDQLKGTTVGTGR